ncbi:MAG: hypothetical protein ACRDTC_25600 [Pseudonocardiaceae bacterium]
MVLTYGDVRKWNANAVDGTGNTVRQCKETLLGLEDDLAVTAVAGSWSGDAATAARHELRKLNDRAEHLFAEAGSVQRALYDASDGVRILQHAVQDADAKAAANQYTITSDGTIRDDAPPMPRPQSRFEAQEMADIQQHRTRVKVELDHEIQRIMIQADEIDRTLANVMTKAAAGAISDSGATSLATADVTQITEDGHYRIGDPEKPHIERDDDFEYDSKDSNWRDQLNKLEWLAKLRGAQALGRLPDGTAMYEHYWHNTGEPKEFDYEKAYGDDSGVRAGVDHEIVRAQAAAEELIRAGNTNFSMTGQASAVPDEYYPQTENWQKAIGGYQVWSHGDVRVDGNTVTMEITVRGEDRYNFNGGQNDIATGASDNENGRFTEIGWAKPFDTHGSLTRTVTWQLGDVPDPPQPPAGGPDDEPRGRERDRGPTPDNPRERR